MLITGIIPARYSSSRFPGKPLARIGDKTMIQMVYQQALKSLDSLYVATDDDRIAREVESFNGNVLITSNTHRSGTDRCAEAVSILATRKDISPDVIINIQGDEPFIKPEQINMLASSFEDQSVEIATLIKKIEKPADLNNPNKPKVVTDLTGNALYFSRSPIPWSKTYDPEEDNGPVFYKHIGIYGYRTATLLKLCRLTPSPLEISESLEQNRWLENGYKIKTLVTPWESIGIDTPEDLENAKLMLK